MLASLALFSPIASRIEFNTATWQMLRSYQLLGLSIHREQFKNWNAAVRNSAQFPSVLEVGALKSFGSTRRDQHEWLTLQNDHTSIAELIRGADPHSKDDRTAAISTMCSGLAGLCLEGRYGFHSPAAGTLDAEAQRKLADNTYEVWLRHKDPVEASDYLAFCYRHLLLMCPPDATGRYYLDHNDPRTGKDIPELSLFDTRDPADDDDNWGYWDEG